MAVRVQCTLGECVLAALSHVVSDAMLRRGWHGVASQALTTELMPKLDDEVKHELAHWAAFYQHRLQTGQKEIFHLEAFIAKFMATYKHWLVNTFGGQ